VRYRDCARFTSCAIGTWAIGLVRYRELCQFFVCYRVGALSHRALTEPAQLLFLCFIILRLVIVCRVASTPRGFVAPHVAITAFSRESLPLFCASVRFAELFGATTVSRFLFRVYAATYRGYNIQSRFRRLPPSFRHRVFPEKNLKKTMCSVTSFLEDCGLAHLFLTFAGKYSIIMYVFPNYYKNTT